MASAYFRLMDTTTLSSNTEQPLFRAQDVGNYTQLNLLLRVPKGSGNVGFKLKVEHAPVLEEGAFVDLVDVNGNNVEAILNASGNTYFEVRGFMRYIRWSTFGWTSGDAVGLIDNVAKNDQ